jgi:Chaperone of endosialidase
MKPFIQSKQTVACLRDLALLILLLTICFVPLPSVQAVIPAPDGGYPGGNTAEGQNALFSLTTGGFNTAIGFLSLRTDTSGAFNTAIGAGTLLANTADGNTATGTGALLSNTTGGFNVADGAFTLFSNTTGFQNTATGYQALQHNASGGLNTANGFQALVNNIGGANTAVGSSALGSNTNGNENTAIGVGALAANQAGNVNTAVGFQALLNNNGTDNIAVGSQAGQALTTGSNNIDIGNDGVAGESETIRIGDPSTFPGTVTYIAGIHGHTASGGIAVYVNADGQLGTATSSARFKDEIKPMSETSEAILALKPVTFRYKKEIDSKRIPQFGLVAEEVEKVNPDLVARDGDGKPYTVRYDAVNAMLLNEFLKEHATVQELKKEIAALNASLKEQAAQIQKVTAKVDIAQPASQVIASKQ